MVVTGSLRLRRTKPEWAHGRAPLSRVPTEREVENIMAQVTLNGSASAILAVMAALNGRTDINISGLSTDNGTDTPARAPIRTTAAETDSAPVAPKRNAKPRASVRYHVTRRGNGNIDKMAIGAKAKQVLAYLRDHGPRGLAELQAELGRGRNPIKPKTVDGSVYQLRQAELIESRDV
jgi:hypothetical protein